jgi:cytochrome c2
MRRSSRNVALAIWFTFFVGVALWSQQQQPAKPVTSQVPQAKSGEQVFNDNCARCHMPPMVIGPRITGTIIMHMRTRARLSQKDQERLLKYLAP